MGFSLLWLVPSLLTCSFMLYIQKNHSGFLSERKNERYQTTLQYMHMIVVQVAKDVYMISARILTHELMRNGFASVVNAVP